MTTRRIICFIAAGWWLTVTGLATAAGQSYQDQITAIASNLVAKVEAANLHNGTVLDFTDLNGSPTDLGRFLAREFTDRLVETSKTVSFIDRENLDYLLQENKLSSDGLVNPETSRKLGKLIGIDTLVTGTVTRLDGQGVRLSVRAVSIETAKIVAAQSATLSAIPNADVSSSRVEAPATTGRMSRNSAAMRDPASRSAATEEALIGVWEAQLPANLYQMQVTWNASAKRYEGVLSRQGVLSQSVGFMVGELVWTATPTGKAGEFQEEQEGRYSASRSIWERGTVFLNAKSPDEFVSSRNVIFRRVK